MKLFSPLLFIVDNVFFLRMSVVSYCLRMVSLISADDLRTRSRGLMNANAVPSKAFKLSWPFGLLCFEIFFLFIELFAALAHMIIFAPRGEAKVNWLETNTMIMVTKRYRSERLNKKYIFNMNDILTLLDKDKI